ncbi:hypothetical protein ABZ543_08275 [Streptomyces roseifaciens]
MTFEWRLRKLRHRHYGDAVVISANILSLAATWAAPRESTLGDAAAFLAVMAVVTGGVMRTWHHDGPLCEECIKGMPLNAAEEARERRRWRWPLAVCHFMYGTMRRWKVTTGVLMALVLAGFVVLLPFGATPSLLVLNDAFLSVAITATTVQVWVMRTHNRFSPWCPYCPPDEGGDGDAQPSASPQGGHGRPLLV